MTNTLCEAIRHDLHTADVPVGTPVNAPAGAPGGIPSEIQPAASGAEAQTILGPVPLSVAIATTMKQLREECPELLPMLSSSLIPNFPPALSRSMPAPGLTLTKWRLI